MEQAGMYNAINFMTDYSMQSTVTQSYVSGFLCPSEINTGLTLNAGLNYAPSSYGGCAGTWFIRDPVSNTCSDGAFRVERGTRVAEITDGLSGTLGFGEMKTFAGVIRNGNNPSVLNSTPPTTPAQLGALGGDFVPAFGHTEWVNGVIIQTGMTTVFTPNTQVPFVSGGQTYDINRTTDVLGTTFTQMTYVADTSRSFHPGGVNALMMDGSCRFFKSSIAQQTWRALGTRAGGEVLSSDSY
jgi:prepilin-type processing-associated H-X9-DG protein